MIGMKLLKNLAAGVLGLLVVVLLGACGGGGGGGGGLPPGGGDATEAPSAGVIFPPAVSLTDGERVTVRGIAADNDAIAAVRVNGVDATSTDGFATWQASVPLALGPNTLTVETVDMASNVNPAAAEVLINRDVLWAEPVATALDSANNRALVVDGGLDAVIAVNLTDGKRTMVSKASTPEGTIQTHLIGSPQAIALDGANNRALVADAGRAAIVAVDLTTGTRTIVSETGKPDNVNRLSIPRAIALDGATRALVVDAGLDAVVAVDLTTGARTIVSGAGTPADGANPFSSPVAIALDGATRALVVDSGFPPAVLEVDLATGARTIVSNASTPDGVNPFIRPVAIALSANNRALVVDEALGAVVEVNLDDGARVIVSDANKPVDGANPFSFLRAIAFDNTNDRALVVDSGLDAMVAVNLASGVRTVLSSASTPDGANPLIGPAGIGLDSANNRALVIDTSLRAVVAVDLDDGARTIVSNDSTPDAANTFSFPVAIALDGANNRALVADGNLKGVLAVNLDDGARTVLSDETRPDLANPFSFPLAIALDGATRALVVDAVLNAVLAVDLTTGTREIVSDANTPGDPFIDPAGIALDSANTRALVLEASAPDMNLRGVVEVNLDNGTRTPLSSNMGIPDDANPFRFPRAIALDGANNRALVVDGSFGSGLDAVLAVDLTSGVRTVLSNASTPNSANLFSSAQAIAIDSANNRALVVDNEWSGVFMLDLITGERVLFSK